MTSLHAALSEKLNDKVMEKVAMIAEHAIVKTDLDEARAAILDVLMPEVEKLEAEADKYRRWYEESESRVKAALGGFYDLDDMGVDADDAAAGYMAEYVAQKLRAFEAERDALREELATARPRTRLRTFAEQESQVPYNDVIRRKAFQDVLAELDRQERDNK